MGPYAVDFELALFPGARRIFLNSSEHYAVCKCYPPQ